MFAASIGISSNSNSGWRKQHLIFTHLRRLFRYQDWALGDTYIYLVRAHAILSEAYPTLRTQKQQQQIFIYFFLALNGTKLSIFRVSSSLSTWLYYYNVEQHWMTRLYKRIKGIAGTYLREYMGLSFLPSASLLLLWLRADHLVPASIRITESHTASPLSRVPAMQ